MSSSIHKTQTLKTLNAQVTKKHCKLSSVNMVHVFVQSWCIWNYRLKQKIRYWLKPFSSVPSLLYENEKLRPLHFIYQNTKPRVHLQLHAKIHIVYKQVYKHCVFVTIEIEVHPYQLCLMDLEEEFLLRLELELVEPAVWAASLIFSSPWEPLVLALLPTKSFLRSIQMRRLWVFGR